MFTVQRTDASTTNPPTPTATSDATAIAALAGLIARKAAEAPAGTDLGHARLDLLAVAAAFYGADVGNPERAQALGDAGLLANDNGAADRKVA